MRLPGPLTLLGLVLLALPWPARADDSPLVALEPLPATVSLDGPAASQRLVVLGVAADGSRRDLTGTAELVPLGPAVGIDGRGRIVPRADGPAEVAVRVGSVEARVPVTVAHAGAPRVVSFGQEVVPALTRLGCNMGACHGSQYGKGGFKLSLLGFEPADDFAAIVKGAEGRRVDPSAPEESLLLLKPTMALDHGGGRKMAPGGREAELIRRWLEQGAPGLDATDPAVTGLSLLPAERRMEPGQSQAFVALATFADGTTRDVTDDVKFGSLQEGTATVTADGLARIVGQGEAVILGRYRGQAAMARLTVPYAPPRDFAFPIANVVDERVSRKWRSLGLVPSPPCTDAEFLRRAMLDTLGTTPTPDEVDAFLADPDPDKRTKLVDTLLARPEYVDYWALKWGDILRINGTKLGAQGMQAFNLWLRRAFRENRPFDRMVDELVTAQGSIFTNGPANYYRVATGPDDLAETTAQVFLGVRLQCAKCHHHPFESYGQDDYYGLAAYFVRIKTKGSDEFGIPGIGQEQVIYVANKGELNQPRTGKKLEPTPLGAAPADDPVDRRRALSRWLTGPDNRWLSRNVANRYWGYLMGRGLVEPIDDLRDTNPASDPELLDALAKHFRDSGSDLKALLRLILTSQTYQRSARTTPDNRLDDRFYSHYPLKRVGAEALLDAINAATGTTEKFALRPGGTRAISLPDPSFDSYFLDTFGRPERAIACECERSADPTLGQALHLMNGDLINRKLAQPDGRLARMLKDPKLTDATLVQTLYRATFGRPATEGEVEVATRLIAEAPSRAVGAQDLLWGLLNSREFLFVH